MFTFAVFDVCTPEPCEAQILPPAQSQTQLRAQHSGNGTTTCEFEEDCFSCAHYAPGTSFALGPVDVIQLKGSEVLVLSLDGAPFLPYHPPRA